MTTKKRYEFPIIVGIAADSYEEALVYAKSITDDLEIESESLDEDITIKLETEFERDGSEENQRVLYLHNENSPIKVEE